MPYSPSTQCRMTPDHCPQDETMYSWSPSVEVQTDPPIVHYTECPTDMTSDLIVGMQSEINRITAQNVMLKEQINSFEFNEKMFTHVMVLFSFSTI